MMAKNELPFFTAYGPKRRLKHRDPGEPFVQQHFRDQCNINKIMERYERTGVMAGPQGRGGRPMFGDVSMIGDYQNALQTVSDANEAFESLPAEIRKRFDNNPAALVDFVKNPQNRDEAIELGMLPDPRPPASGSEPRDNDSGLKKADSGVPEPDSGNPKE